MSTIIDQSGQLKKKIAERETFLKQILEFVETFVLAHGKQTRYEECSDHINRDMELRNFNGFNIFWSQSRGHHIEVCCVQANGVTSGRRLLHMNYWHTGIEGCEVVCFDTKENWQQPFIETMENAQAIWAKQEQQKQQSDRLIEDLQKTQKEYDALQKKATRLGL